MKQTEPISRWAKQNVTLLGIFINKSMWFIGFNLAFLRHAFKPFRIKLVIPWENKTLGDFPKYIPPQKRSTSLCRNDIKCSHNTRNNAQNFTFKKKLKILGFKSWAELCQWCWMLVLQRFFPPTQQLSELISRCSWDMQHMRQHQWPSFPTFLTTSSLHETFPCPGVLDCDF